MRDLLSKLDAIVSETELKNPKNLQDKLNALADLEKDPVASSDPEISSAITQKKSDLEREAKSKDVEESFQIGDAFGISFSEDFEIGTDFFQGRDVNHNIVFDNLLYEQYRWDDRSIYYYIDDTGQLVARINTKYDYPSGIQS